MKKYKVKRTIVFRDEVEVIASNRTEAKRKASGVEFDASIESAADVRCHVLSEQNTMSREEMMGLALVAVHACGDDGMDIANGPWIKKEDFDERCDYDSIKRGSVDYAYIDEYGEISLEFGIDRNEVCLSDLSETKQDAVLEAIINSAPDNGIHLPEHLNQVRLHWFDPARNDYSSSYEYRKACKRVWHIYRADTDMLGIYNGVSEAEVLWGEVKFIGLKK